MHCCYSSMHHCALPSLLFFPPSYSILNLSHRLLMLACGFATCASRVRLISHLFPLEPIHHDRPFVRTTIIRPFSSLSTVASCSLHFSLLRSRLSLTNTYVCLILSSARCNSFSIIPFFGGGLRWIASCVGCNISVWTVSRACLRDCNFQAYSPLL